MPHPVRARNRGGKNPFRPHDAFPRRTATPALATHRGGAGAIGGVWRSPPRGSETTHPRAIRRRARRLPGSGGVVAERIEFLSKPVINTSVGVSALIDPPFALMESDVPAQWPESDPPSPDEPNRRRSRDSPDQESGCKAVPFRPGSGARVHQFTRMASPSSTGEPPLAMYWLVDAIFADHKRGITS